MTEFNIYALNNIKVADDLIKTTFKLHGTGPDLNWAFLEKAKELAIAKFPEQEEQIIEDFARRVYKTKKKLAKRGLLFESGHLNCEVTDRDEAILEDEYADEDIWDTEGIPV